MLTYIIIGGVVLFFILNPILFKYIFGTRYWRYFWAIPNVMIISLAVVSMIRYTEKKAGKIFIIALFSVAVLLLGTNAFTNGNYTKLQNKYKISDSTCAVCAAILEKDENPKCILGTDPLYTEARQYSGNIQLLYGRDAAGYIMGTKKEYENIHSMMESEEPDYNSILTVAYREKCDIIVNVENKPIADNIAYAYGYELLTNTNGYNIYYNQGLRDSE